MVTTSIISTIGGKGVEAAPVVAVAAAIAIERGLWAVYTRKASCLERALGDFVCLLYVV